MTKPLPVLEKPSSLLDFVRMFTTDEACAEYLFRVRHTNGFVCPKCSSQKGWPIAGRGVIECNNGHQVSLKAGTVMHRSRQHLTTWFYAAYLMSTLTPGISALQFQKQLGIKRYETAFNMLHKLRSALVAPEREKLKGEVEVDECYIGGPEKEKPGRSKGKKSLVVVSVEIVRWIDTSGRKAGRHVTQYDIEGPGAGTLEGGLCSAIQATHRRQVRREPEPAAALLPVPGHPETLTTGCSAAIPAEHEGSGHRSVGT